MRPPPLEAVAPAMPPSGPPLHTGHRQIYLESMITISFPPSVRTKLNTYLCYAYHQW